MNIVMTLEMAADCHPDRIGVTCGERSLGAKQRSTKSGPGRCSDDLGTFATCERSGCASAPRTCATSMVVDAIGRGILLGPGGVGTLAA